MESVTAYNLSQYQPYRKLLHLQQRLCALRSDGRIGNVILLLEHAPVITIGRTLGAEAHLLGDPCTLQSQGIDVCAANRGGDITYHGPGQLVVYFILALIERDLHWFVRKVEQSVVALLAQHGIQGHCEPEYPGVWVRAEKICALGIYVRKWVTMHGIALNVCPKLAHFDFIIPCGIVNRGVTSMQKIYQATPGGQLPKMEQIKQNYLQSFAETFHVEVGTADPQQVWRYLEHSEMADRSEM